MAEDFTNQPVLPSPSDCQMVYAGAAPGGALVQYDARAGIRCGRPGNTAPYGAGTAHTTTDPVPDGTPCQTVYYAPVTFQDLPGTIRARWQSPAGVAASASIDPSSDGAVVSAAGVTAATNDVSALYKQLGTYQGGQCQLAGGWQDFCQLGAPLPDPDPCILAEPHRIVPDASPPPSVRPYVQDVLRELRAQPGTIRSLPSPSGLVNLPTCFWIDGMGVPGERDLTMVLAGPPDPSNRRIYYTYLIRVFFAGVRWDFDDPYGNDQVLPHPACGQHPELTAHSYQMISEKRSADGFYHVTATEEYQVTVDLYWADTYGAHHQPVDPGVPLPLEVTPPGPLDQYVGQVEAIPVSQASPGG